MTSEVAFSPNDDYIGEYVFCTLYMLWFNFILGLNFIFLSFKLIIIYYHTPKQRKLKFKPRIKLNRNILYTVLKSIIIDNVI